MRKWRSCFDFNILAFHFLTKTFMKHKILLPFLLFYCISSFSQEMKKEYQKIVLHFIECVKNNKKDEIANMISYPFRREYPIPSIQNKKEFLARYDEIFDNYLKKRVSNSKVANDWGEMGWRGIMFLDGKIWLDYDGRFVCVNYQSEFEKKWKEKLIRSEKDNLHSSIKEFKEPVCILETVKYRIRLDDLGKGNFRYASWSLSKSMNEKPDLIISKGEFVPEGSGGNHSYVFKNGDYIYECSIIEMGEEDSPPARLTIYKKDEEVFSQDVKKLFN